MEEGIEDMNHETLKSGSRITQEKGNVQEFVVSLMISKCSLGDVFFLHTYLLVAEQRSSLVKYLAPPNSELS
jgi:hypothetical protein